MRKPASDGDPPEIVDILRLASSGEGVGKCSTGEVLFVPGTAPGDRVEVGSVTRKSGARRASLLRILVAGPDRREPPCPHVGQCGGCDFMHVDPAAQLRYKREIVQEAMVRVGGLSTLTVPIRVVSNDRGTAYRSRIRLHVDRCGQVGFLSARSHRIVPIARCHVAHDLINRALVTLSTTDEKSRKRLSFCDQIELRVAEHPPHLAARIVPCKGTNIKPELYASLFPPDTAIVVADSKADHDTTQSIDIAPGVVLRVPLSAFTQVHREVNRALVATVVEAARDRAARTFLDAYAGAGNFAIPLLAAGLTGEAVDTCAPGVLSARDLARDMGLPFTGFSVGDARDILEHFAKQRRQFDFVVLDPPRQGAKAVLDAALALRPNAFALVACDPVALARDLSTLVQRGARIASITLFDMFPETHHTETLAVVDL